MVPEEDTGSLPHAVQARSEAAAAKRKNRAIETYLKKSERKGKLYLYYIPSKYEKSIVLEKPDLQAFFRFQKEVDFPVEHFLDIARFGASAVVFHQLVRMEHIGADLIPPLDLRGL